MASIGNRLAGSDARFRSGDRVYRRLQEEIDRKTIRRVLGIGEAFERALLSTDGEEIGQVNGLSVIALGGLTFGNPSRITARVRLGRGEVVDIERETIFSATAATSFDRENSAGSRVPDPCDEPF